MDLDHHDPEGGSCPTYSRLRQPSDAPPGALPQLRSARRDGVSHDAAAAAAEASLREQWPELSAKEASAEIARCSCASPEEILIFPAQD